MYNETQLADIMKQIVKIGDRILTNDQGFKVERITETGINEPSNKYGCDIYSEDDMFSFNCFSLIKKPLTSITDESSYFLVTDEEKINIAMLVGILHSDENKQILAGNLILEDFFVDGVKEYDFDAGHKIYKYLQLKGYALPQLVMINNKPIILSVEKLVELKIFKI